MLQTQHSAGPGRSWNRVSEYEVGRPKLRFKRNPVPAAAIAGTNPDGSPAMFPYPQNSQTYNATLQLLAWNLRDTYVILANKTWNAVIQLFTTGQNGALSTFGAATQINKPVMLANVQSNNGLLPSPQSFLVTHLRRILRSDIGNADLTNLMYSTYLQFVAGDQNWVYFEGPSGVLPGGAVQPNSPYVGTTYAGANSINGVGWPTVHNVASIKSNLYDPTIGAEDMGYNISQNKQFRVNFDPTQFSFIADTVAQGGWATTNAGGTGIQDSTELCGVLARSMNG